MKAQSRGDLNVSYGVCVDDMYSSSRYHVNPKNNRSRWKMLRVHVTEWLRCGFRYDRRDVTNQ